jgi:hypothetical protein
MCSSKATTPSRTSRAPFRPSEVCRLVFKQDWELVALHHAGGRFGSTFNEGIPLKLIVEDIKAKLGDTDAGQAVLTKLAL